MCGLCGDVSIHTTAVTEASPIGWRRQGQEAAMFPTQKHPKQP